MGLDRKTLGTILVALGAVVCYMVLLAASPGAGTPRDQDSGHQVQEAKKKDSDGARKKDRAKGRRVIAGDREPTDNANPSPSPKRIIVIDEEEEIVDVDEELTIDVDDIVVDLEEEVIPGSFPDKPLPNTGGFAVTATVAGFILTGVGLLALGICIWRRSRG